MHQHQYKTVCVILIILSPKFRCQRLSIEAEAKVPVRSKALHMYFIFVQESSQSLRLFSSLEEDADVTYRHLLR